MTAYIAFSEKDGSIKAVKLLHNGEIDEAGIYLNEYFNTIDKVKKLVKCTINYIDEDQVSFLNDQEYYTYSGTQDFFEDMNSVSYYYWFDEDQWYALKPNHEDFRELELIIEEEY